MEASLDEIVGEGKLFAERTSIRRRGADGRAAEFEGPPSAWGEWRSDDPTAVRLREIVDSGTRPVFRGPVEYEGQVLAAEVTVEISWLEHNGGVWCAELKVVGTLALPRTVGRNVQHGT